MFQLFTINLITKSASETVEVTQSDVTQADVMQADVTHSDLDLERPRAEELEMPDHMSAGKLA